ncbi:unnamed protein product [Didymodactylos carnosus]|nr:unnamed protein product [Didymodactylos carnosus]CAF4152546.1 unnamed protein product [Didymodactylos carnosus]
MSTSTTVIKTTPRSTTRSRETDYRTTSGRREGKNSEEIDNQIVIQQNNDNTLRVNEQEPPPLLTVLNSTTSTTSTTTTNTYTNVPGQTTFTTVNYIVGETGSMCITISETITITNGQLQTSVAFDDKNKSNNGLSCVSDDNKIQNVNSPIINRNENIDLNTPSVTVSHVENLNMPVYTHFAYIDESSDEKSISSRDAISTLAEMTTKTVKDSVQTSSASTTSLNEGTLTAGSTSTLENDDIKTSPSTRLRAKSSRQPPPPPPSKVTRKDNSGEENPRRPKRQRRLLQYELMPTGKYYYLNYPDQRPPLHGKVRNITNVTNNRHLRTSFDQINSDDVESSAALSTILSKSSSFESLSDSNRRKTRSFTYRCHPEQIKPYFDSPSIDTNTYSHNRNSWNDKIIGGRLAFPSTTISPFNEHQNSFVKVLKPQLKGHPNEQVYSHVPLKGTTFKPIVENHKESYYDTTKNRKLLGEHSKAKTKTPAQTKESTLDNIFEALLEAEKRREENDYWREKFKDKKAHIVGRSSATNNDTKTSPLKKGYFNTLPICSQSKAVPISTNKNSTSHNPSTVDYRSQSYSVKTNNHRDDSKRHSFNTSTSPFIKTYHMKRPEIEKNFNKHKQRTTKRQIQNYSPNTIYSTYPFNERSISSNGYFSSMNPKSIVHSLFPRDKQPHPRILPHGVKAPHAKQTSDEISSISDIWTTRSSVPTSEEDATRQRGRNKKQNNKRNTSVSTVKKSAPNVRDEKRPLSVQNKQQAITSRTTKINNKNDGLHKDTIAEKNKNTPMESAKKRSFLNMFQKLAI